MGNKFFAGKVLRAGLNCLAKPGDGEYITCSKNEVLVMKFSLKIVQKPEIQVVKAIDSGARYLLREKP